MYAFGSGGSGQLGLGDTSARNSPFPILSPSFPSSGRRSSQVMDHDGLLYLVKHLYGGGDHCLLLARTAEVSPTLHGTRESNEMNLCRLITLLILLMKVFFRKKIFTCLSFNLNLRYRYLVLIFQIGNIN